MVGLGERGEDEGREWPWGSKRNNNRSHEKPETLIFFSGVRAFSKETKFHSRMKGEELRRLMIHLPLPFLLSKQFTRHWYQFTPSGTSLSLLFPSWLFSSSRTRELKESQSTWTRNGGGGRREWGEQKINCCPLSRDAKKRTEEQSMQRKRQLDTIWRTSHGRIANYWTSGSMHLLIFRGGQSSNKGDKRSELRKYRYKIEPISKNTKTDREADKRVGSMFHPPSPILQSPILLFNWHPLLLCSRLPLCFFSHLRQLWRPIQRARGKERKERVRGKLWFFFGASSFTGLIPPEICAPTGTSSSSSLTST